jgi:hypothetical protein
MKYCKLRIAWSVGCGILCLLVIVLWVRSYSHFDRLSRLNTIFSELWSVNGGMRMTIAIDRSSRGEWALTLVSLPLPISEPMPTPRFHINWMSNGFESDVPHWFVAVAFAANAGVPWLRWRFSLRMLLIAMTLVAVGLVWIVCAVR